MSQKQDPYSGVSSLVFPRKLDTALRASSITGFIDRYQKAQLNRDDRILAKAINADNWPHILDSGSAANPYIKFLDVVTSSTHVPSGDSEAWMAKSCHRADRLTSFQIGQLMKNAHPRLRDQVQDAHRQFRKGTTMPPELLRLGQVGEELQRMVEKSYLINDVYKGKGQTDAEYVSRCTIGGRNSFSIPMYNTKFWWSKTMALIHIDGFWYVAPKPMLLLFMNKICDLLSVSILYRGLSGTTHEPGLSQHLVELIRIVIQLDRSMGKESFKVIKSLEAIAIGETLRNFDDWENDEFINALIADLEKEESFSYIASDLKALFSKVSPQTKHELARCTKLFGHPYVDMEGGVEQLKANTRKELSIDKDLAWSAVRYAKRDFLKAYLKRNKRWAPVTWTVSPEARSSGLVYAMDKNLDPDATEISIKAETVSMEDYDQIDVEQVEEFDYVNCMLPMLKDRSISLLTSEAMAHYVDKEPNTENRGLDQDKVRLLLFYILREDIVDRHVHYIKLYENAADLDELMNYLIIKIVPKEKELKEIFRGFGVSSYEERSRRVVQEYNVANFLDVYSHEQAMTISELEIVKKLYAFRKLSTVFPDHTPLYVTIDASKWNNFFRDASVRPVMRETLSRLFGNKIFDRTQEAFEKTFFYCTDQTETYTWQGQLGGIEGLSQDSWVYTYIAHIKACLGACNDYPVQILCKGDDLRIVFMIPNKVILEEPMSSIKNRLVSDLEKFAKKLGHKIKIDDSYGSPRYLNFSKAASLWDIEMGQATSKIQKCYGANNAVLPCPDDYIGAALSNAHSAARVTTNWVACYKVGLFWASAVLELHPDYKKLDQHQKDALLLIPNLLGGFPMIYLHNFFVRAESDLLTPFLGIFQWCEEYQPAVYRHMTKFLCVDIQRNMAGFMRLLHDPYALAIDTPPSPGSLMKKELEAKLRLIVQAPDIRELLERGSEKELKPLIEALYSLSEWDGKLLAAIYSAGPAGLVKSLITQFESARTMIDFIVLQNKSKRLPFLKKLVRTDKEQQLWRINTLRGTRRGRHNLIDCTEFDCTKAQAEAIRREVYGRPIRGVTMADMGHLVGLSSSNDEAATHDKLDRHFSITVSRPVREVISEHTRSYKSSGQTPFLGLTTSGGIESRPVKFNDTEPLLSRVKQLLDIRSFLLITSTATELDRASNVVVIIDRILEAYLGISSSELDPLSSLHRGSGTMMHYLHAPQYRASIIPNTLSNYYTQVRGSSLAHKILSDRRNDHFAMNFLHIYCHGVALIFLVDNLGQGFLVEDMEYWLVTPECDHCFSPIIEEPLQASQDTLDALFIKPYSHLKISAAAVKSVLRLIEERDLNAEYAEEPDQPLTLENAAAAICRDIIDYFITGHKEQANAVGIAYITYEASEVLDALGIKKGRSPAGPDILRRIPYSVWAMVLGSYIQYYFAVVRRSPNFANTRVHTATDNPHQWPWTPVVYLLYNQGLMVPFTNFIHENVVSRTQIYADFENPVGTCRTWTKALWTYAEMSPTVAPYIVILGPDRDIDIHHGFEIGRKLLMSAAYLRLLDPYAGYSIGEFNTIRDRALRLVAAAYLIYKLTQMDEEIAQDILTSLMEHEVNEEVLAFDICRFDLDEYELGEMMDEEAPRVWSRIRDRSGHRDVRWADCTEVLEGSPDAVLDLCITALEDTRMVVCRTTRIACHNTIRAAMPVETEPVRPPLGPLMLGQQFIDVPKPYVNDTRIIYNRDKFQGMAQQAIQAPVFIDFPRHDRPRVPLHPGYRLYVRGNNSPSRWFEVFEFLNLLKIKSKRVRCLVVGDGHGGATAALCCKVSDAIIYYQSLKRDAEVDPYPHLAREVAPIRGNAIRDDLVQGGYDDLTNPATYTAIKALEINFDVILCDMDSHRSHSGISDHYMALGFLAQTFIRRSARSSMMVLKVPLNYPQMVSRLYRMLAYSCRRVFIFSLHSEGPHKQMIYVAAWHPKMTEVRSEHMGLISTWPTGSEDVHRGIVRGILTYASEVARATGAVSTIHFHKSTGGAINKFTRHLFIPSLISSLKHRFDSDYGMSAGTRREIMADRTTPLDCMRHFHMRVNELFSIQADQLIAGNFRHGVWEHSLSLQNKIKHYPSVVFLLGVISGCGVLSSRQNAGQQALGSLSPGYTTNLLELKQRMMGMLNRIDWHPDCMGDPNTQIASLRLYDSSNPRMNVAPFPQFCKGFIECVEYWVNFTTIYNIHR
jgi:hypothetical protein